MINIASTPYSAVESPGRRGSYLSWLYLAALEASLPSSVTHLLQHRHFVCMLHVEYTYWVQALQSLRICTTWGCRTNQALGSGVWRGAKLWRGSAAQPHHPRPSLLSILIQPDCFPASSPPPT